MLQSSFYTLLGLALEEDLGDIGDVTSQAIFSDQMVEGRLISRQAGILAGREHFSAVFAAVDGSIRIEFCKEEGSKLQEDDTVALVRGPARSILSAERIALNFLSFLSGIATVSGEYVDAAKSHGNAVILDTRKTLPGYRRISKYAVLVGGGANHRMGLYDMVMIKDNHIDAAGSITAAVNAVRRKYDATYRIEVECRTLDEVREALSLAVDIIMLDNMSPSETAAATKEGQGKAAFEASGDMDVAKVREYSPLGVDYISVGRITHSAPVSNFSLQIHTYSEGADAGK